MNPSGDEQLPASSYTPLEMEMLDRRDIDAWLDSISGRLEVVKRDFSVLYPQFAVLALPEKIDQEHDHDHEHE